MVCRLKCSNVLLTLGCQRQKANALHQQPAQPQQQPAAPIQRPPTLMDHTVALRQEVAALRNELHAVAQVTDAVGQAVGQLYANVSGASPKLQIKAATPKTRVQVTDEDYWLWVMTEPVTQDRPYRIQTSSWLSKVSVLWPLYAIALQQCWARPNPRNPKLVCVTGKRTTLVR